MTTIDDEACSLKMRRWAALPFYAIALALSYLSEAFEKLAAAIARDP